MDDLASPDLSKRSLVDAPTNGSVRTLGDVLTRAGRSYVPPIGLEDILVIRHAFKPGDPIHLNGPEDLTQERVIEYTRVQWPGRFPSKPPRYWVILVADGGLRSRLFGVFENHGEVKRNDIERIYDLRQSSFLSDLADRLVVEYTSPRSWYRYGKSAEGLSVLETR
ncbi:hypothetical protein [Sinomonas sp. G460-2]|uniref:hypothetical protein n=1 Tax=Sinomonas sp. G460-2 TaxID=3393464 RepID=UPI0039EEA86E